MTDQHDETPAYTYIARVSRYGVRAVRIDDATQRRRAPTSALRFSIRVVVVVQEVNARIHRISLQHAGIDRR